MAEKDDDVRKEIRKELRRKMDDAQKDRESLVSGDTSKLFARLNELEDIYPKVKAPREACLDLKLVRFLTNVGKEKIQALNTSLISFEPVEFAEKLVTKFKEGNIEKLPSEPTAEEWRNFGNVASLFFFRVPSFHFMSGSFEKGEVVRKQRRHFEKVKDGAIEKTVIPEKLASGSNDQETTAMEVERVNALLWNLYEKFDNPIDYFEFVVNPHSFGQTIENIFHVSFLVKDGLAEIRLDDDNLPVIAPVKNSDDSDLPSTSSQMKKRKQMIITLTKQEWKEIVKVYGIENPLITPRSHASAS